MKKALESLVNAGKEAVKGIGRFVKKHAREELITLALASPFVMANKAEASEGKITIDYNIEGYTGRNLIVAHHSNSEEGFGSYDFIYHNMFDPSGISSKITSMVEGKELDANALPLNSTSTVTFSYTVIAEGDREIPPINNPYFNISTNGFDGEDVFITVEGVEYDAKTVGTIPLANITGSGSVSFVPHEIPDPNIPEPNMPPLDAGPHILRIDNVHGKFN